MPDFNAKMHQSRFRLGLCHRPRCGSLQRFPQTPCLDLKGLTSNGRGRRGGARPVCLLVLTILATGLVAEYRTRNREVAGSTHTRSTTSNFEQAAKLLRA